MRLTYTKRLIRMFLACSIITVSLETHAEIRSDSRLELPRETNGIELLVGLGGSYDKTAYLGEETMSELSPAVAILTDKLYIDIHDISYRFRPSEDLFLKLFVSQDGLPSEEDLPADLMIKSGDSIDAGFLLQKGFKDTPIGQARMGLLMVTDVTGTHSGFKAELSAGIEKKSNIFRANATIGTRYRDSKRSNYYFGVAENEENSLLPSFSAKDEWTAFAEASFQRHLTRNIAITINGAVTSLSGSAKKSPRTVNNTNIEEVEVSIGLIWQFRVFGGA